MPPRKNKVTSSANRSKRKTTKPVSSDKGRRARARVSTAKVSSSEGRPSTGSARVTGGSQGKPTSKPAGQQRAVQRRQEANRKAQNARAQRINAGAKPTASAGRGGALVRRQPNSTALTRRSGSSPSTTKNGRQPRAITNGRSATMRQIRAKDVQARRMGQGKSTVASRNTTVTPNNARGQRIRDTARVQRVIGDSGKVRAAQVEGRKIAAEAKAKRGAKQAMSNMEARLRGSRTARAVRGAAGLVSRGGAAAAGLQAYNTGDSTLTAAQKRGDAIKGTKYTNTYNTAGPRDKVKASDFNKKTFNEAFRTARSSSAKEFTWRGNRYNTKKKGE